MNQRRRRIFPNLSGTISLAIVAAFGLLTAPAHANEAAERTVSLMTYHATGEALAPSKAFTGVALNGRFVVTSRWALEQGHTNPFAGREGELAQVRGVVRQDGQAMEIDLAVWEPPRMMSEELALLEVAEEDREALADIIPDLPALNALEEEQSARLLGIPAPLGVDPVSEQTIPPPLELSIDWDERLRRSGTLAVPGDATYPPQMAGAGVWNRSHELYGVLVREDNGWWIVDASVLEELGNLAGLDWEARRQFSEFGGPELRRPDPQPRAELRGIYEILDRNGLQMQMDRNLVDHVDQTQADQVMAMIAGGEYERAITLLDRIEPLVTGRLMEQMTYRRALALVFLDRADDARQGLTDVEDMEDDRARARGRLLRAVIEADEADELDGTDITNPTGLVEACLMVLGEWEREYVEQLRQIRRRVGMAPGSEVLAQLDRVRDEIEDRRLAWPGYFEPMLEEIDELRAELVP